ncbi:MAG: TPM domain-containing protein [Smithellaceae bacterium]
MKKILNNQDRSRLDKRIAEAEKRTGAQIVIAVIHRSDSYLELPWKAFALGVSVAGLLVFIFDLLWPGWYSQTAVLISVVTILMTGIISAILSLYIPKFARFFLAAHRAEVEVRQYAKSLFLSHELFATQRRTGILLLVSLFERQVILLPDTGLSKRLNQKAMQKIITQMTPPLASGQVTRALENGLMKLTGIRAVKKRGKSRKNELRNEVIEEKGV